MTKEEKLEYILADCEERKAFKQIFRGKKGKLGLSYLDKNCFVNETTYVKGDPYGTAFHEGMRQTLLNIRKLILMSDESIDADFERRRKQLKLDTLDE